MEPQPPPNYKEATVPGERCRTCRMGFHWHGDDGRCWSYKERHPNGLYTDYKITAGAVCDSWARDSNYKAAGKES